MKIYIPFILLILASHLQAQPTNEKGWYNSADFENMHLGWTEILSFKTPSQPFSQYGWKYTANQSDFVKDMAQIMQQSYNPLGYLGELKKIYFAQQPGLPASDRSYDFNDLEKDNHKALPNSYGISAKLHRCIIKTKTHKYWPMTGHHCAMEWKILANQVHEITKQLSTLSSTNEYYFIQPLHKLGMSGKYGTEYNNTNLNYRNFSASPNLTQYEHYFDPEANRYVIIMSKDHQSLPFENVTIGEFVSRIEQQFSFLTNLKKKRDEDYVNNYLTNAQRGLQLLKEKLKPHANEKAFTNYSQIFDFVWLSNIDQNTNFDAFIRYGKDVPNDFFPIQKLKKGTKEACATSAPQWIVFSLGLPLEFGYSGSIDAMENFVSQFNYEYIYQKYFGNEKPATAYKKISVEKLETNQKPSELSEIAKQKANDKSVLYFEDFSGVTTGTTPKNWSHQKNQKTGEPIKVVEIDGAKGKWLQMFRTAYPQNLSLPLKGNFSVSFDILVRKGDVPWGTPPITLKLEDGYTSKNPKPEYIYAVEITSGDMNRADAAGWISINSYMPDNYGTCRRASDYSIPAFTGSKPINSVRISLVKKGEALTILCNNKEVYSCPTATPADIEFKKLYFQSNEKNLYHIGNIEIIKL